MILVPFPLFVLTGGNTKGKYSKTHAVSGLKILIRRKFLNEDIKVSAAETLEEMEVSLLRLKPRVISIMR